MARFIPHLKLPPYIITRHDNIRKQFRTLYRSKIRMIYSMNFQPMSSNAELLDVHLDIWNYRTEKLIQLASHKNCGHIIWSNVYFRYRLLFNTLSKMNIQTQQYHIDRGFQLLRIVNHIRFLYMCCHSRITYLPLPKTHLNK